MYIFLAVCSSFHFCIHLSGDLALDESHGLAAVDGDVLLVVVGVVAVAAVRVLGVAVRLDDAGRGRRAREASGASSKLREVSVLEQ